MMGENSCRSLSLRTILKKAAFVLSGAAFFIVFFFPTPCASTTSTAEKAIIKIGVLAKRGPERCLQQWSATADYLSGQIPDYKFVIVPLSFKQIHEAVALDDVDFILANPAIYVELEFQYGVNRILTMKNLRNGKAYTLFGGVIFCKADRDDIQTLADLKGKRFMAVEEHSFGGWIMAWRELHRKRIDPYKDFRELTFGFTHDNVVQSVLDSETDVGTVRTDTLERMAAENIIQLADFKIINRLDHSLDSSHNNETFPFVHSTNLYPEWPLAKVKGTADELARQVAIALLLMEPHTEAAQTALIEGWTIPLNYQPVHDCLKELQVGPYAAKHRLRLKDVINHYLFWVVFIAVALAVMLIVTAYVLRLNRALSRSRDLLNTARSNLENRVKARTRELVKAEEKARQAHAEIDHIFNTSASGMTVINNDYVIEKVNDTFTKLMGITRQEAEGLKCYDVFPGLRCNSNACPLQQVKNGKKKVEIEDTKELKNGAELTCMITATPYRSIDGDVIGIVESFMDISDRKKNEIALAEFAEELSRSNRELEQFAYVASHDLQEPLRMVASYVQLLARRYKGKLDEDADEFIDYAVDGANRMKQLIQDLLQFSRVTTKGKEFELTSFEDVLKKTLNNLKLALEDSDAVISNDPLPSLMADSSQMVQLLQNLIGNAIKFRGNKAPRIHIGSEKTEKGWLFSVQDNGIGFDIQYKDRIFDIFQRLHTKDEYEGTGIGLAVSKRIVERHGGRIWVESEAARGTTFYFLIPPQKDRKHG